MKTSSPAHRSAAPSPDHLTTAECWDLLERADLGRLALVDDDGAPAVYPVNITAHEGSVYLRSADDAKLALIARHPAAALEVDGGDASTRWSVVLRGVAGQVRDEAEIAASSVRSIRSASPTRKPVVIKLTPRAVTGRRFDQADAEPHGSGGSEHTPPAPQHEDHPDAGTHGRQTRPVPIPHFPPTDGAAH